LTADKLLERLSKDDKQPYKALSFELACLMLSLAESQDIDARMVEITSFKGEKRPADPPGKLGRFGVALGPVEKGKPPVLYDVWGARSKGAAKANVNVLDPGGVMAPYYGISALSLLARQEMSEALKLNNVAVKLDPENPYYRAGRGFIFAATGVPDEALMEFEKAVKKRGDAVQKTNLAEILLLVNPMDARAESEVQAAIDEMPDFARAHALKGMIHLIRREKEQAETELGLAERLDPKSPAVAMYWARYYAAAMKSDEAVAKALDAVRLSEDSVSSMLALAGIYREVARFDDMRATLDRVFEKVSSPAMADQIKQIFDYDPSEKPSDSDDEALGSGDLGDDTPPSFELKLGGGLGKDLGGGGLGKDLGGGGLGKDLGGGLGSGLGKGGGGLGGGGLGQGDKLKLDMNLKQ
jgi:tetratricopeptide (TPR) repeat protein